MAASEKYTLETTRTVMERAEENLTSALSSIRDTDVALERSRMVRTEILAQVSFLAAELATGVPASVLPQHYRALLANSSGPNKHA